MSDLFKSGTDLANFGVLALLGIAVVGLVLLFLESYRRTIKHGERALAGWEAATAQFERALDLIEKMQDRRRGSDGAH